MPERLTLPTEGEPVPISIGDARQLADALFHAGTGPGVVSEYIDEANGLHFYVLDTQVDERGVRTYEVGVRAAGSEASVFPRSLAVTAAEPALASPGRVAVQRYAVSNSSRGLDLVRLSARHPDGWDTRLQHEVIAVPPGATVEVPVYVRIPEQTGQKTTQLELVVRSETDSAIQTLGQATIQIAASAPARDSAIAGRGGSTSTGLLFFLALAVLRRRRA